MNQASRALPAGASRQEFSMPARASRQSYCVSSEIVFKVGDRFISLDHRRQMYLILYGILPLTRNSSGSGGARVGSTFV
jgi:hypothetical protein